jgi:D-alanyl-D-alanine carboxypeptidase (penicillin-binding protein 5/6)
MIFRNTAIPYVITLCLAFGAVASASVDDTVTIRLEENQPDARREIAPECVIDVPAVREKAAPRPVVKGESAVLMDAVSGQVLYEKNAHTRRPNASTTKIMTAILMIENLRTDEIITASKKAAETPYSAIHLKPGEQITMYDLLMGLMIRSANDAAVAAAEHTAGSVQKFAAMMNKKAAELGCVNTHFVNPNGLYNAGHYSSAYDLCLMARHAIRYPLFNTVVSTKKHILSSRTVNRKDLAVYARTKFMRDYPGADGIKSGYIKQARYCYVGSVTRDGWRLVSAVLRSENSGADTSALMDYGFANFRPVKVAGKKTERVEINVKGGSRPTVAAAPAHDLVVVVPSTGGRITTEVDVGPVTAPVAKGARLGIMKASVDGAEVAKVELRAAEEVEIGIASKLWSLMKYGGLLAVCLVVGSRYGTAFTKSTRRRGRRISSVLRDHNSRR